MGSPRSGFEQIAVICWYILCSALFISVPPTLGAPNRQALRPLVELRQTVRSRCNTLAALQGSHPGRSVRLHLSEVVADGFGAAAAAGIHRIICLGDFREVQ